MVKSQIIRVRMTDDQRRALEVAAHIANIPPSTYVHAKIIDILRDDGHLPDPRKPPVQTQQDAAA